MKNTKNDRNAIKKVVTASLFAALICVATMIIKIPSPLKGYLNLGDCVVLLAGWMLSPVYAFAAAGIGSALADIFSGYAFYAPATFLIKGLMSLLAFYLSEALNKKLSSTASRIISGISAEILMVCGYFLFEGILYGFAASAVNIPANAIQGTVGIILGILIIKVLDKRNFKI